MALRDMENKENKIAVLIDGENISQNDIDYIFTEIKKDGQILISRLYCGVDNLKKWEEASKEYSIKTVTQYNYVSGKNTSDSSLIIDAMDILYTKEVDSFYILSSDSDFTGIITRLKEENKRVIGVGEKKTPKPIINACNKFVFIENLRPEVNKKKKDDKSKTKSVTNLEEIIKEIQDIVAEGRIQISRIKEKIDNMHPEFDLRNYGKSKKFLEFMKEIPNVNLSLGDDKTSWFAELSDVSQIVSKTDDIKNENNPSLDDVKEFIIELINNSKDKKINIGQLSSEIKKHFSNFVLKNYGVTRIGKFIELYGDQFKYDNDKKPNFLLLGK